MSEPSVIEPSPEHLWLAGQAGEWDVDCAYWSIPGEDPLKIAGKETVETLGSFWIVGRFEADMVGTPIVGLSVTGYDPVRRLYSGSWKDSYTPFPYRFEGTLEEDGTLLVLEGENYDPMRQRTATYRCRTKYNGDAERVMDLSVDADGSEVRILEYRFTKR
jgi:hypothetical protein